MNFSPPAFFMASSKSSLWEEKVKPNRRAPHLATWVGAGFAAGGVPLGCAGSTKGNGGCTLVFGCPLVAGEVQGQRVAGLKYCSPIGWGVPGALRSAPFSNSVWGSCRCYISRLAYFACSSMNSRRGGTSSPISMEKILSASAALLTVT